MEIRLKFVLIISSALLALVTGECTTFEFNASDHHYNVHPNPYTVQRERYRVSAVVNCTSQLAQSDGGTNSSTCGFHRYPMGLTTHSRAENWTFITPKETLIVNLAVDAATRAHIFSLVQAANPPNITSADFNATIVMNFTANPDTEPDLLPNESGFYGYTPTFICWNGTLSGCNSSDGLEGARIQACGLKWIDDTQYLLPTGQQQYAGRPTCFRVAQFAGYFTASTDDISLDPWPTYDELAGNATVNQNATANEMGDDNGESSAWIKDVSFLTLMVLVGCSAIANCL
ncbi:hypothetical protein E0Z10_g5965 [Xylaria hypoxylon]|uniref:Autophagy-related protein 27 n=1 Tax=Xylaria hypoxylon TaxID=37992 RepID=A0A4Z0YUG4_9PEZI|nr:hypothetical protein E0Z10_g5965 [Xylaria hypoxylon]